MKLLAATLFVIGCSSPAKQPTNPDPNPTPPDPTPTGDTAAPDTTAVAPKPVEPPPPPAPDTGGYKLVAQSALTYGPLDPKNPGPELAAVSGGPDSGGAFFLRLPPGTKSGLHTHTADYHAVVVSGAPRHWVAGADKKAKPLGAGSYWFQPGGQPHGDECTGTEPCVLFLVMSGALDFTATPTAKAVKPGKYSLVARKDFKFKPIDPKQPKGTKMAVVSGDPKTGPVAFVLEVPSGSNAGLHSHTSDYHALVLGGAPAHWLPHEANEGEPVAAGTYWYQPGGYDHGDRCTGDAPCHAFVFMAKALDFKPAAKK